MVLCRVSQRRPRARLSSAASTDGHPGATLVTAGPQSCGRAMIVPVSPLPPETRYVEVNGAQVGYQVVGHGPNDLVFASGLGSHIDLAWDLAPAAALIRDLASISRYIVFDRRGTGVSDPIRRD